MSDRDALLELLALHTQHEIDAGNAADAILAAGWRPTTSLPERVSEGRLRQCPVHPGHAPFLAVYACPWCEITKLQARSTVTPEQVDAAATAIADYVGGIAWGRDVVSVVARQLGLSVAEDGEQSPLEQLRRQHLDHAAIREALERADGEWDEETGDGPANPLYLDQLTAAVTAKWNQA